MNMKLELLRLEELSNLQYAFYSCPLPQKEYSEALMVSFTGEYGIGCQGNGDARFMTAIISAAMAAWEPSALILDLRTMKYEWGDLIDMALCAGNFAYTESPFPTAVITSELNRKALTSLLRDEMFQEPGHWLYDTIEEALASVESQMENPHKSTVE